MALIRLTPATALSQVRQTAADLKRVLTDAGVVSLAAQMPHQFEGFERAYSPESALLVEVWIDDGTADADALLWLLGTTPDSWDGTRVDRRIARGTAGGRRMHLILATAGASARVPAGEPAPSMLAWLRGPSDAGVSMEAIESRPLVLTTKPMTDLPDQIVVDRAAPMGALARLLGPSPANQTFELLQAAAAAMTLDQLAAIGELLLDQELRAVRAKRVLAQQRAAAVTTRQPAAAPLEVVSGIRARLPRTFSELSRGIDERFTLTLSSPAAPFWAAATRTLGVLQIDEQRHGKTVVTSVPESFERAWWQHVRDSLRRQCVSDLTAIRDTLRLTAQEIEDVVESGGPPIVVTFQHLTDDRVDRLLDSTVVPQRHYQGEMTREGFMGFLMTARRYQMVLFMMLSTFGLSFLRDERYAWITIPITIALFAFGVMQVVRSSRHERRERMRKEIERARETLMAETRRIITEFQRAWTTAIGQHLTDQTALAIPSIEAALRESANKASNADTDERQRLQRHLPALEAADKRLTAAQKSRETLAQTIAHARGELQQLIATAVRGITL